MVAFAEATDLWAAYPTMAPAPQGQVDAALNAASAAVRSYTGQLLDYVVNDTVTLDVDPVNEGRNRHNTYVRGGEVFLPQAPVVSVSQVLLSLAWRPAQDPLVADIDYTLYPDGRIRVYQHGWAERLQVTYTHGFATMPDDIVFGVVLPYAARLIPNPEGRTGFTRGTVIDMWSPAVDFYPNERAILDPYRVVVVA